MVPQPICQGEAAAEQCDARPIVDSRILLGDVVSIKYLFILAYSHNVKICISSCADSGRGFETERGGVLVQVSLAYDFP